MRIYIVFLKNLRCFYTYQIIQIFIAGNRADVSLFKQTR